MSPISTSQKVFRFIKVSLVVLILAFVVALAIYDNWAFPGYDPIPFSPESWLVASDEERGHMLDDLLETYQLEGFSQQEVFDLLGDPHDVWMENEADDFLQIGFSMEDINEKYGDYHSAPLEFISYSVGYRGRRKGAPFCFPYFLHFSLEGGRVDQVSYDD